MTDRIIELARVGFGIIPCNPDKTPRIPNWSKESLRDPAAITAFWQFCPDSLVGYTPPAGTMVVDVDTAGLSQIGDDAHPWPAGGWQYRTPSGGLHAVLALPEGIIGKTDTGKIAPGIDRRAHGTGYAIAWFLHGHEFLGDGGAYQAAPEWTWRDLVGTSGAAALKPFGLSEAELRTLAARAIKQSDRYDDYTEWYQLGMMLHHETGGGDLGLELFDQISRAAPKYEGSASIAAKWRSFDTTGGLRIAKLIADTGSSDLARAAGARAAFRDHIKIDTINVSKLANDINTLDLSAGATSVSVVSAEPTNVTERLLELGVIPHFKTQKFDGVIDHATKAFALPGWGSRYGYDTFKQQVMFCPHTDPAGAEQWRPMEDVQYTQARLDLIAINFDPKTSAEVVRDAILYIAKKNQFDSAQIWLGRQRWDGVPRIERFMVEYCGAKDTPYAHAIGRYLWSAAAGRILLPGAQADMIPVFISETQGLSKTKGIQAMDPHPDFYAVINLAERDDDLTRHLRGKLICELDELKGIRVKDVGAVKSWITLPKDSLVPKFMEFAVDYPRRFVMIATTNEYEFLDDPTGARRWLPIEIAGLDREAIARDCVQFWAEGAELFRSLAHGSGQNALGCVDYKDAERLARNVHGEHTVTDEWTQTIEHAIETLPVGPFQLIDLFLPLGMAQPGGPGRQVELRIAHVLRQLGYRKRQCWHEIYKKNMKMWIR